ncbi:hypothetical protein GCM10007385_45340 [Tateyamaria omphalii]|uniref:DUF427 domain-containing protein n=1 Tax=Tateyamaria omphalii TaxID=299262 RepID=UPI001678EEDF|nr:DUF427 domain-containing protein [Tateyamaria omphalii]GGX71267.1 hypothetical protein GCM10007385_45340 [Tateyamaria omphalii]
MAISQAKKTRCPLEGDATYYNLTDGSEKLLATKTAYSYDQTFEFAKGLKGLIAFEPLLVTVIEAAA